MSFSKRFPTTGPPRIELLDEAIVEVLRGKTPAERVALVFDAERTMRLLLETHLRARYPDWNAEQVSREIARRRNLGSS